LGIGFVEFEIEGLQSWLLAVQVSRCYGQVGNGEHDAFDCCPVKHGIGASELG
jgi:hypothetical protein